MKNIKTIIILLVLIGLGYFVFTKVTGKKTSLSTEALSNFAIKDTSSVDKINLSDTQNHKMTFIKKDNVWTLEDGSCVQQHMIREFLETFKYISVKGPTPIGSLDNVNKQIVTHHKKVEIFQNGKLSKTWYIGSSTQDHLGTYVLLKDPVLGKSPEPFIMYMPNMHGTLSEQFSTNKLDYICSGVFKYNPLNIKSVNVEIPDSSHLNFKIVAIDDNQFELYNNDLKIEKFDTSEVRKYLMLYKKIHFEHLNRTANTEKIDSLKKSTPYYTIEVTDKDGDVNKVYAHLKLPAFDRYDFDGNLMTYDKDRLWLFDRHGELSVCQYFVFGPLFRDINYFKAK